MGFAFADPRPRRRPSLTPMIDVVFLLLVFFMLAARFGDTGALPLSLSGEAAGTGDWTGPPRLVDIGAETLRLNGAPVAEDQLVSSLMRLLETDSDPILLRPSDESDVQRLLDVMARLDAGGLTGLILVAP